MIAMAAVMMLLWVEGESFNYTSEQVKPARREFPTSSGPGALYGPAVASAGSVVRWNFDLAKPIAEGKFIFRYSRLHWREDMKAAHFEIKLNCGGWSKTLDAHFDNTGGWGHAPNQWGIYELPAGNLPAGNYTMQMTSMAEINDINLDGFFVAPANFSIAAEELNSMVSLKIDSGGYTGVVLQSTSMSQDAESFLPVASRSFTKEEKIPNTAVTIQLTDKSSRELEADQAKEDPNYDRSIISFPLGEIADGFVDVKIDVAALNRQAKMKLYLTGNFMATLDSRIEALSAFNEKLQAKEDKSPALKSAAGDFAEAMAFLSASHKTLKGSVSEPVDAWRAHLAANEGVANPAPLAGNMQKVLLQYEKTAELIEAGKDPYEGRVGEFRRSWKSQKTGEQLVYRNFVPDNYNEAKSVPLILMLHGGGGNENTFHDIENGKVLELLNKAGYLMIAPKYHVRRQPTYAEDIKQLLDKTLADYPKIDRKRIYSTGVSMGGFSSFAMAANNPETFAAISCVSGAGEPERAEDVKTTPMMIIQGGADTVVPPSRTIKMVNRLKELGYVYEYHVFEPNGHGYEVDPYLIMTLEYFDKHRRK